MRLAKGCAAYGCEGVMLVMPVWLPVSSSAGLLQCWLHGKGDACYEDPSYGWRARGLAGRQDVHTCSSCMSMHADVMLLVS